MQEKNKLYKLHGLNDQQNQLVEQGLLLPLMESFYTLQGEGYNTGQAAYFIRLGGCDIGCHWCDVKESWNANVHALTNTVDIIKLTDQYQAKAVVVTGGEPLIYNLNTLTDLCKKKQIKTFIETSGSYPLTGNWDWICLSPKKLQEPLQDAYDKANELKVIVHNKNDFEFAEYQAKKTNASAHLYIQPEWSKHDEILPSIINYIKQYPKWKISLQTHKYMKIP